jgi:D-alanine-D-alanine ligase
MKPKIALITGGYSNEAIVSYKSARTIENNVDKDKYDLYKIDIHPAGWFYLNGEEKVPVDKNDFSITLNGNKITFDAVLVGLHGTPGEDGKLQGYFDLLNIPYTSCDAATSALTMNKRYTVAVAAFGGINVAKSLHLFRDFPTPAAEILAQLSLPLFVKPNSGGSSIGMSRVDKAEELAPALEKAFKEDSQVLVEEFISGREFTVGVYRKNGTVTVLPITEIKALNHFFDFEAKYEGKSVETTPAEIAPEMKSKIENTVKNIYEVFNCRGVVRVDIIFNEEKNVPYMLEINTVPGQSDASVIPQQVRASGGNLKDFYGEIIQEALARK